MIQQEPHEVAADLLSQAEHDARACSVLVTPSSTLAESSSGRSRKAIRNVATSRNGCNNRLPIMA